MCKMNTFVVGLLCLVAVSSVVIAYDFADEDYNEFVLRDILAIVDSDDELEANQRFRRQTAEDDKKCKGSHTRHHGFYKCCNDEADTDSIHEKYITLKKECHSELRNGSTRGESSPFDMLSCGNMNRTKEDYVCVKQCVGQKLNILDNDGNIIEAAARQHVSNDISQTEWQKKVADEVSTKCIAETKAASVNSTTASTDSKCNSASLKFSHCVWREFTRACPAELQSDSRKCVSLREKILSGDKLDDYESHHHGHGGHGGHGGRNNHNHHHHHRSIGASGHIEE